MKLRATLTVKKRLTELGWKVRLNHQEGCAENTHWYLNSNIPYRSRSWPRYQGGVLVGWSYGVEYKEWKESFRTRERFVRFLKRYYRHYINFWDWDELEDAIIYEESHIYKLSQQPNPTLYNRILNRG